MSAAARPKIALCSPAARPEAALLERHGYRVTASATATADVVMPARGGALAFVLHRAEAACGAALVERAATAARAARRCSLLVVGGGAGAPALADVEALESACPPSVNVLLAPDSEEAVRYMMSCAQHVEEAGAGAGAGAADASAPAARARFAVGELARLTGQHAHAVDFLLATRSLSKLSAIESEREWAELLRATDGLLDAHLVHGVLSWVYAPAAERAPAAAPREREREREAKVPRLGPPPASNEGPFGSYLG